MPLRQANRTTRSPSVIAHKWLLLVPESLDRPLCHRPRGLQFQGPFPLAFIYEIRS